MARTKSEVIAGSFLELSVNHRSVSQFLTQEYVAHELRLLSILMAQSRDTSPYIVSLPKRMRFFKKFGVGIYATQLKRVVLGEWNEMHYSIASLSGAVVENQQTKTSSRNYISADYFILRAVPQLTILKLSDTWMLQQGDVPFLENQGYLVMNQKYNWVVSCHDMPNGFKIVSSHINTSAERGLSIDKYLKERK